jgi:hypothetical protein
VRSPPPSSTRIHLQVLQTKFRPLVAHAKCTNRSHDMHNLTVRRHPSACSTAALHTGQYSHAPAESTHRAFASRVGVAAPRSTARRLPLAAVLSTAKAPSTPLARSSAVTATFGRAGVAATTAAAEATSVPGS